MTISCGNLLAIAPFSPNTYVLILIGQVNTVVEIKGHHSACCVVAEKPLDEKNTIISFFLSEVALPILNGILSEMSSKKIGTKPGFTCSFHISFSDTLKLPVCILMALDCCSRIHIGKS